MYKDISRLFAMIKKLGGDSRVDDLLAGRLNISYIGEPTPAEKQKQKYVESYERGVAIRNFLLGWEYHGFKLVVRKERSFKEALNKVLKEIEQYASGRLTGESTELTVAKRRDWFQELYRLDTVRECFMARHEIGQLSLSNWNVRDALEKDDLGDLIHHCASLIGRIGGLEADLVVLGLMPPFED